MVMICLFSGFVCLCLWFVGSADFMFRVWVYSDLCWVLFIVMLW